MYVLSFCIVWLVRPSKSAFASLTLFLLNWMLFKVQTLAKKCKSEVESDEKLISTGEGKVLCFASQGASGVSAAES